MWKSSDFVQRTFAIGFSQCLFTIAVVIIALLLQCTYGETINDDSRLKFAADVVQVIAPKFLQRNFVVSPASVQTVLALAFLGAEGDSAEELIKGLHLEGFATKEALAKDYDAFIKLVSNDGGKVQWANRIYLDNKFSVSPKFSEYAAQYFGSAVGSVNFANSAEAAGQINKWVEEKTHDKIKDLLKSDAVDESTAIVLINALYFKADWRYKFKVHNTANLEFSLSEHEKVSVPTMKSAPISVRYCESDTLDMRTVELPYQGTSMKMLILLPNKVEGGIAYLQPRITPESLALLAQSCKSENVVVTLPKFKIETDVDLKQHLKDMGFSNIFSDRADFSSMLSKEVPITISDVKQKVYISVDENGSEAAAATYAIGTARLGHIFRTEPIEFVVDRPFGFGIIDEHALYFVGHVIKPEFA